LLSMTGRGMYHVFQYFRKGASKNFQTVANTFQTWMKHV
jgi:hypothetical protein